MAVDTSTVWKAALVNIAGIGRGLDVIGDALQLSDFSVENMLSSLEWVWSEGIQPRFDMDNWTDRLIKDISKDPEIRKTIADMLPENTFFRFVIAIGMAYTTNVAFIDAVKEGRVTLEQYKVNELLPFRLLDPMAFLPILHRSKDILPSIVEQFVNSTAKHGYTKEAMQVLEELSRQVLPIGELQQLTGRRFITPETLKEELRELGVKNRFRDLIADNVWEWPNLGLLHELERRDILTGNALSELYDKLGFPDNVRDAVKKLRERMLDVNEVGEMVRRGLILPADTDTRLKSIGVPADDFAKVRRLWEQLYDEDTIKELFWRKFMPDPEARANLTKIGYTPDQVTQLMTLWNPVDPYSGNFPPFVDVIKMAVRDAFDEEAVQRYGLDVNYPDRVAEFADRSGFGEYWAKMYWRAHWQLPQFATARQMMFLSDSFSENDLAKMLVYADYPPYLIQPLMDATYNPLTRVDVRRMHLVGTLTDEQLFDSYKRLGFNSQNAQRMADFTIAYNATEETSNLASLVIKGYEDWIFSRQEALTHLLALDYKADEAIEALSIAGYKRDREVLETQVRTIREQYLAGQFNFTELSSKLAALGYPAEGIEALTTMIEAEKQRNIRLPTRYDCDSWLHKGLIDSNEYKHRLQTLGYSEADTQLYYAATMGE